MSDVAKVTFTGSVPTGSVIMRECAKDVRRVSLELGGKSAMMIFDDLDDEALIRAAEWLARTHCNVACNELLHHCCRRTRHAAG